MTLVAVNSGFIAWPGHIHTSIAGSFSLTADQTVATGQYQAMIFSAREAMAITHVGFRTSAVTASPTAILSIETVDASGVPSTGGNTVTTGTLSANSWNSSPYALSGTSNIAAGAMFALKIAYGSGTSFQTTRVGNYSANVLNVPYEAPNGTPARLVSVKAATVGSGAGSYYQLPGIIPVATVTTQAFTSSGNTAYGLRFQVPFKCRCVGVRAWLSSTAGDYNLVIRDDGGSELSSSSTAYDGDQSAKSAAAINFVYLDNPVTLSAATWYRAAFEATTATSVTIQLMTVNSGSMAAMPGGANQQTTFFNGATWDDSLTTSVPMMDILIDQVDDGTGTGSGGFPVLGGPLT